MSSDALDGCDSYSPHALLARVQRHDCLAEEEVFRHYFARLSRLAASRQATNLRGRFGADDVAQSALRTFFAHAREGEYTLPPGGDLWQLLAKIALRKLSAKTRRHLAQRRSVRREQRSEATVSIDFLETATLGPAEQTAVCEELRAALAPLREEYRRMVMLRLAGYTIAEIAAEIPCCERTVFRALERFGEIAQCQRSLGALD